MLVNNRKQLLAASYQAIAMNEAKIENFLAKKVVDNPNELSGARPAGAPNARGDANTNSVRLECQLVSHCKRQTRTQRAKQSAANAKPSVMPGKTGCDGTGKTGGEYSR